MSTQQYNHDQVPTFVATVALLLHLCMPMAMAVAWIMYFSRVLSQELSLPAVIISVSGIAAVYGLDRLLDPDPRLHQRAAWLRVFLVCTILASLIIVCLYITELDQDQWLICAVCVFWTFANWLGKKVCGAKTLCVCGSWLCAVVVLPAVVFDWHWAFELRVYIWLILFAAACILCDIKDVGLDRLRNIASMPVVYGEKTSCIAVRMLCLLMAVVCVSAAYPFLALLACSLALFSCAGEFLRREIYAPLCIDSLLTLCAVAGIFVH
ncbi:MAG: hypothetical protein HRU15_00940 [Planctomycetes bacterium]|nr:hypothetical protein [Planctomycetota bacterium]